MNQIQSVFAVSWNRQLNEKFLSPSIFEDGDSFEVGIPLSKISPLVEFKSLGCGTTICIGKIKVSSKNSPD